MKRLSVRKWVWLSVLALSGCTTCASPYDCDYPAFGGRVERVDRKHGRVNSIFSAPMDRSSFIETTEPIRMDGDMLDSPQNLDWDLEGQPTSPQMPGEPNPALRIEPVAPADSTNEQASVLLELAPSGGQIQVGGEAAADIESESPSDEEPYEEEFFELSLTAP